jgi:hypothetical protein
MRLIERSKLVTVNIPIGTATGAVIPFPDIPELRDKRLTGIEFYDDTVLTTSPDQLATLTAAQAAAMTLTLKRNSVEHIQDVPLQTLNSSLLGGIWKEFEPFIPNYQSSFLRNVGAGFGAAQAVAFNIFYLD